ncbi:hypothetical protein [Streptomyces crystallinus]
MSPRTPPGSWDGPWYRVSTQHFEAAFLPDADEDRESVDNVEVFVDLRDGSRWSATMITLAQVGAISVGPPTRDHRGGGVLRGDRTIAWLFRSLAIVGFCAPRPRLWAL